MAEPISIQKLVDLSPTAVVKSTSSTIKGLLVILAIAGIGYGLWKAYVKKPESTQTHKTTINEPAEVNIDQRQIIQGKDNDVAFLGVRVWRIKLGISLLQQQSQVSVTDLVVKGNPTTQK